MSRISFPKTERSEDAASPLPVRHGNREALKNCEGGDPRCGDLDRILWTRLSRVAARTAAVIRDKGFRWLARSFPEPLRDTGLVRGEQAPKIR